MLSGLSLREATPDDAALIAAAVHRGFEGYREFAPAGWTPPDLEREVERVTTMLGAPDTWCAIAEHEGSLAGHATVTPAVASVLHPTAEPALGHLRGLFVEPPWWGSGLARELHARAIAASRDRGMLAMRLFTPEGQLRARRFYERESWTPVGATFELAGGLPTLEYRRALG